MEAVFIRGPAGFGKSTYAKKTYVDLLGYDHYEADMFHIVEGKYQWDVKNIKLAHEWCYNQFVQSCKANKNVVVSNTFTQLWELDRYISYCRENAIRFYVVRCTHNYGSVHNVPQKTIENMINKMEDYKGEELVNN